VRAGPACRSGSSFKRLRPAARLLDGGAAASPSARHAMGYTQFWTSEARHAGSSAAASKPRIAQSAIRRDVRCARARHPQSAKNIGRRPLRSAIRIGLEACKFPRQEHYDEDQADFDARQSQLSAINSTRLTTELQWSEHGGDSADPSGQSACRVASPSHLASVPNPNGRTPTLMIARPLCGCERWRNQPTPAQFLRCSTPIVTG
jgi:hypothetical protein